MHDRYLQLLTAFVDGELSKRQRKAVLRLLHRSSEARTILKNLQENAIRLKQLPRRQLGPKFSQEILAQLPTRTPAEKSTVPMRRSAGAPWRRWAMAAAVLAAVCGTLLWNSLKRESAAIIVQQQGPHFDFRQLPQQQERLEQQIARDATQGLHVEMTVKNEAQAVSKIQEVMKNAGLAVVVDSSVKEPAQGKNVEYLVYAENVTPAELQTLLQNLVVDARPAPAENFQTLLVHAMSADDRKLLSSAFGVEDEKLQPKPTTEILFQDTFIEKTESKPKTPAPPARPLASGERLAVILAHTPGNEPNREMQTYLRKRQHLRPGTLQVLIKIHGQKV